MSQINPTDSLAHSKWRCQYHVVFAPKYRRRVIYGKIKADIGKMLRKPYLYVSNSLIVFERIFNLVYKH